jgi:signal transduction histidine kinase
MRAELDVALLRPRSTDELTETLRSVDAEVQRLIDLSNALLDLEELGSTGHITRAPASLADLLDAAVNPHRRTAERVGRDLTVDTTRVTVDVDARWLRPAVSNLVDNALRHGQGTVRVAGTVHEGVLSLDPPIRCLWITLLETRKCLVTCDDGSSSGFQHAQSARHFRDASFPYADGGLRSVR